MVQFLKVRQWHYFIFKILLIAIDLKAFVDDNFKFDENVRKFSKKRENTVGKAEIALSHRAISPFPTVFPKDLCCRHVKTRACLGKG